MIMPLFIGTTEIILIGGLALLLFGGKKLPEMMKGLGQGVQSFKKAMKDPLPEDEQKMEDLADQASPQDSADNVNTTEIKEPDSN